MTPSRAVRLLCASDPSFRYAEHKKVKSFYDADVFYYQGTAFIDEVEQLLVEEMKAFMGCAEVETRCVSGQMSNTCVFSALMDWKNRLNRKQDPKRLGYIMNNHIIKGGHLSAQPMGALHDYIAVDPVTERHALVNFPVLKDNIYKIDVEETKKAIDQYRPEFIIFGKSMVLHKEPVAAIRKYVDDMGLETTSCTTWPMCWAWWAAISRSPLLRARRLSPAPPTKPSSGPSGVSSESTTGRATSSTACGRRLKPGPSPAASPTTTWALSWACSWPLTR